MPLLSLPLLPCQTENAFGFGTYSVIFVLLSFLRCYFDLSVNTSTLRIRFNAGPIALKIMLSIKLPFHAEIRSKFPATIDQKLNLRTLLRRGIRFKLTFIHFSLVLFDVDYILVQLFFFFDFLVRNSIWKKKWRQNDVLVEYSYFAVKIKNVSNIRRKIFVKIARINETLNFFL